MRNSDWAIVCKIMGDSNLRMKGVRAGEMEKIRRFAVLLIVTVYAMEGGNNNE